MPTVVAQLDVQRSGSSARPSIPHPQETVEDRAELWTTGSSACTGFASP